VVWPIPYGAIVAGGTETEQELITEASSPVAEAIVSSDWFKPNPGQTAFTARCTLKPMIEALRPALHERSLAAADRFWRDG